MQFCRFKRYRNACSVSTTAAKTTAVNATAASTAAAKTTAFNATDVHTGDGKGLAETAAITHAKLMAVWTKAIASALSLH